MGCPRCSQPILLPEDLTRVRCEACGWTPLEILEHFLHAIAMASKAPGIEDWREAASSLAYAGQGATFALAQLGFITGDDRLEWNRRLFDAAGIESEEIEVRADASSTAEAEVHDEDDGEGE